MSVIGKQIGLGGKEAFPAVAYLRKQHRMTFTYWGLPREAEKKGRARGLKT